MSPISPISAKFSFPFKITVLLTPTKSCTVQARRNGLEYYEIESGLDEAPSDITLAKRNTETRFLSRQFKWNFNQSNEKLKVFQIYFSFGSSGARNASFRKISVRKTI